jgi:creatinine amidohydrolase
VSPTQDVAPEFSTREHGPATSRTVRKKVELAGLTWTEAAQAFRDDPVVLLPMGSIEQHGPQTPVGDYRYMTEVARGIAERTPRTIVAPTIPWGHSEYFKNFPGCMTLRPETLKALLFDTLDAFLRHGVRRLVFVCGHKGNMPMVEQVARQVLEERSIRIATIEPIGWLSRGFLAECYGRADFQVGHGSDPMSSIALHLFPGDARPDLVEDGAASPTFAGLPIQGMSGLQLDGIAFQWYCNTEELSDNGVLGDPRLASAEVGRRCVERMVDLGSRFVAWFAEQDVDAPGVRPRPSRATPV